MTRSIILGLTLGILIFGCGDDSEEESVPAACKASCPVQVSLNCPAEQNNPIATCEAVCAAVFRQAPRCEAQMTAFLQCPDLSTASGWECDSGGSSQPKSTSCPVEQAALEACASAG